MGGVSVRMTLSICLNKLLYTFVIFTVSDFSFADPVLAHAGQRGFVMLLPTQYYLVGGTIAVAASFLLLAFDPPARIERLSGFRLPLFGLPGRGQTALSLVSFAFFLFLLFSGLTGSRDPLANPLPIAIWTLWWVGFTFVQAAFGDLWSALNPWTGPNRLVLRILGRKTPYNYPEWLSYWSVIAGFLAFAWYEMIYLAPDDPEGLAMMAGLYWLVTFAGTLLFGDEAWRSRAECFSIFFRFVASLSPLVRDGHDRLNLAMPGAALLQAAALPLSGVLFLLLNLASVSFDGLNKTFWWLALGGINPLEFPGRSVTVAVGDLAASEIDMALDAGLSHALRLQEAGIIHAAALFLAGESRTATP